ncbi:MAG: hypothetical protein WCJ02_17260, partial [bacterium]
ELWKDEENRPYLKNIESELTVTMTKPEISQAAIINNELSRFKTETARIFNYFSYQDIQPTNELLKAEFDKSLIVTTITGRAIEKGTRKRVHAGTVLCWLVQGSIADLVNEVGLQLLTENKARLVMPIHDSLICIVNNADKHLPIEMIKEAYRKNSLPEPRLKVETREREGAQLNELGG